MVNIYRDVKRRGIYLALFTDPEGDSCFSIYQISWIKTKKRTFCKLKTSLTFRGFCQAHFTNLLQIFYLPVNTDQPKLVAFLVFSGTTASFVVQISSSENVLKRDAILAPVASQ